MLIRGCDEKQKNNFRKNDFGTEHKEKQKSTLYYLTLEIFQSL